MPHLSGIISDKTWVHSIREYSEWLPLLFLLHSSFYWVDRDQKYTLLVSSGLINACVSAHVCRERGAWMLHSFKKLWVSLAVPLWLLPLWLVLSLVCLRNSISSSQNKSIASCRRFCLQAWSYCLKLSLVWAFRSYMYSEGWTEMGHIFSWKRGSVNFLLPCIWKTWAHLPWKMTG